MQAIPQRSDAEILANSTFDALLWALSRPGTFCDLPEPGEAPVIAALLDRECLVYAADPLLVPLVVRSGARLADISQADHVFLGARAGLEELKSVTCGSDLYPDDGATVVLRADLAEGPGLRLSGPGVNGSLTVSIGGLPDGFWQTRSEAIRYPMGFDLFFIDGARVMGLPRSTNVEVL